MDKKSKKIGDSDYSELITIISAIGTHDRRILDFIKAVSERKRYHGTHPISFRFPVGLKIDEKDFARSVILEAWERTARLAWLPFEEAKEFVAALEIGNQREWWEYIDGQFAEKPAKPADIPVNPQATYANMGWANWGDWLGTGYKATRYRTFRPFLEARRFARSLRLKTQTEWKEYVVGAYKGLPARPEDIPMSPEPYYKAKGWTGWGDWLGTGRVANQSRSYMPFREARKFARALKLKNGDEWRKYARGELRGKEKPENIPGTPDRVYKNKGWRSWGDWLGTNRVASQNYVWRPYPEALKFVHKLGLKTSGDWAKYSRGQIPGKSKKPDNIPANPAVSYKKDWVDWDEWLGRTGLTLRCKTCRKNYPTKREAAKEHDVSPGTVNNSLVGERPTREGHQFEWV